MTHSQVSSVSTKPEKRAVFGAGERDRAMGKEFDTLNRCLVGVQGDRVRVMNPQASYTRDEAIMLAAYLITMADMVETSRFPAREGNTDILQEVAQAVRAVEAA
jgi:hypothetical protein